MEEAKHPKMSKIHELILGLLRANPDGLDIYQIRELLPEEIGVQQHLDKRIRELRKYYEVPLEQQGGRSIYSLKGRRKDAVADDGAVSSKLRAEVLHRSGGRCQMCGRTVADDGVKLQVDHKIPHNWGGATELENLWALCALCNSGKRDYFSSFDDETMQRVLAPDSVYERLIEALRVHAGGPTPSWLLEFVANADDFQEDWQRRLRELRYPRIGADYSFKKEKLPSGKVTTYYILTKDVDLPDNHVEIIREESRKRNRKKG